MHVTKFKLKGQESSPHHTEDIMKVEKFNLIPGGSGELGTVIQSTTITHSRFPSPPYGITYASIYVQWIEDTYIETNTERETLRHMYK